VGLGYSHLATPPTEPDRSEVHEETRRRARLQQLGDLLKQGILTDEEFAAQKAKVLGT
jgi:hypothetical protein